MKTIAFTLLLFVLVVGVGGDGETACGMCIVGGLLCIGGAAFEYLEDS